MVTKYPPHITYYARSREVADTLHAFSIEFRCLVSIASPERSCSEHFGKEYEMKSTQNFVSQHVESHVANYFHFTKVIKGMWCSFNLPPGR